MASKNQTSSKETNKKSEQHDKWMIDFEKWGNEIGNMVKKAKTKYDQSDDKTKKKVIAGVAGAAALLAGAIGYKKMRDKKKK